MTTKLDRDRPSAHWDGHTLTVRASAQADCRRALWYAATGQEPTNPPDEIAQVRMDAGRALESVVIRAMRRAGWQTTNYAEARRNVDVRVQLDPGITIEGTPDARGIEYGDTATLTDRGQDLRPRPLQVLAIRLD